MSDIQDIEPVTGIPSKDISEKTKSGFLAFLMVGRFIIDSPMRLFTLGVDAFYWFNDAIVRIFPIVFIVCIAINYQEAIHKYNTATSGDYFTWSIMITVYLKYPRIVTLFFLSLIIQYWDNFRILPR